MNKDTALRLALEALRVTWYHVGTFAPTDEAIELYDEAITAIKAALEEKEAPVLRKKPYLDKGADYERGFIDGMQYQMQSSVDKAVNAMSQRKPLTDEQIEDAWASCEADWDDKVNVITLARAIEAAHNIKE